MALCTPKIVGHDGRTIARAESDEGSLVRHITEDFAFSDLFLTKAFERLVSVHKLTTDTLMAELVKSPVWHPKRHEVLKRGVEAFFANDHIPTIHILVPEIESAIRSMAGGSACRSKNQIEWLAARQLDYDVQARSGSTEEMAFQERAFAQKVFDTIKQHDAGTTNPASAYCEFFEKPQVIILRDTFQKIPGTSAAVERPYELKPSTCVDLFVQHDVFRCNAEYKGICKSWFPRHRRSVYPGILLSPYDGYRKDNSVGLDLRRLALFTGSATTHVAQIVVGSSLSKDDLAGDLDHFAHVAELDKLPWQAFRETWSNQHHRGYVYDIRVWISRQNQVADWWQRVKHRYSADLVGV